jgi:hypothetical protein
MDCPLVQELAIRSLTSVPLIACNAASGARPAISTLVRGLDPLPSNRMLQASRGTDTCQGSSRGLIPILDLPHFQHFLSGVRVVNTNVRESDRFPYSAQDVASASCPDPSRVADRGLRPNAEVEGMVGRMTAFSPTIRHHGKRLAITRTKYSSDVVLISNLH